MTVWEIRKICCKKSFLFIFSAALILTFFISFITMTECRKPGFKEYMALCGQYAGRGCDDFQSITGEQDALVREHPEKYKTASGQMTALFLGQGQFCAYISNIKSHYDSTKAKLPEMEAKLKALDPSSYDAAVLRKDIESIRAVPKPVVTATVYENLNPYVGLVGTDSPYNFLIVFEAFIIIFSVCSVYGREYKSNLNELFPTTQNGRTKALFAKGMAAVTTGVVFSLILQLIQFAFYLYYFRPDWSAPFATTISDSSAYDLFSGNISIGDAFIILILLHTLGCVLLALSVLFVGALTRSSTAPLFIGIFIWAFSFLVVIFNNSKVLNPLYFFSVLGIQAPSWLPITERYMDFFGNAVYQYCASAVFGVLASAAAFTLHPFIFKFKNSELKTKRRRRHDTECRSAD